MQKKEIIVALWIRKIMVFYPKIIYLEKYLSKRDDIDNINVDYSSSYNIKMVPMNLKTDKNEIVAMQTIKKFK